MQLIQCSRALAKFLHSRAAIGLHPSCKSDILLYYSYHESIGILESLMFAIIESVELLGADCNTSS